jgi:signal transduction histidine kinase
MRVCQFRHDGKCLALRSGRSRLDGRDYAIYSTRQAEGVKLPASGTKPMRPSQRKSAPRKSAAHSKAKKTAVEKAEKPAVENENVKHLRTLAHDLSNSLEAILQASYLLSHAKLDTNSRRWAQLIDTASQDAARTNREMRKALRSLCDE